MADGDFTIIGLSPEGTILCVDEEYNAANPYDTGETPEEFGVQWMRPEELQAIGRGT